jgi:hypothetical protein
LGKPLNFLMQFRFDLARQVSPWLGVTVAHHVRDWFETPQRQHTVDLRCDTTVIGLVRLALPDDAAIEVAQKISQDLRRNRLG